jgi:hypothetical protein
VIYILGWGLSNLSPQRGMDPCYHNCPIDPRIWSWLVFGSIDPPQLDWWSHIHEKVYWFSLSLFCCFSFHVTVYISSSSCWSATHCEWVHIYWYCTQWWIGWSHTIYWWCARQYRSIPVCPCECIDCAWNIQFHPMELIQGDGWSSPPCWLIQIILDKPTH